MAILVIGCATTKTTGTLHHFNGSEAGCGNFIVFKLSEDSREFVSVSLDARNVEYGESLTLKIGDSDGLKVRWKKYNGDVRAILCNDVGSTGPKLLSEKEASSGKVEIRVSEEGRENAAQGEPYQVTLILKNVIFEGVTIDYLQINNVNVGWIPG